MRRSFYRRVELEAWAAEHAVAADAAPPGDWPSEWRLETDGMAPLCHGDYSQGLSATFAIVNGLRLVSAGHCALTARDEQALLCNAWRWRADRSQVTLERGLRQGEWMRMVAALCEHFNRCHEQYITMWKPWSGDGPTRSELFSSIERLLVARQVVLTLFAGARYSVIRGFTGASWLLFDSGEYCWVKRASVGLVGEAQSFRHQLAPSSLLALRRGL